MLKIEKCLDGLAIILKKYEQDNGIIIGLKSLIYFQDIRIQHGTIVKRSIIGTYITCLEADIKLKYWYFSPGAGHYDRVSDFFQKGGKLPPGNLIPFM